jgi:HTH-type transcriptional regulator/antitoxin HigA
MATETQTAGTSPDLYLDLVRAFPLRPIRSTDEHDKAIATLDALDDRRGELQLEEQDYFLILALLVERYEDEIYGEGSGATSPADAGAES